MSVRELGNPLGNPLGLPRLVASPSAYPVEIGQTVELASDKALLTYPDGSEYLKVGTLIFGEEEKYPTAFKEFAFDAYQLESSVLVSGGVSYYNLVGNSNTLLISTGTGAYLRSTDKGMTWTPRSVSNTTPYMGNIFHVANNTFGVTDAQNALIWLSLDAGLTWTRSSLSGARAVPSGGRHRIPIGAYLPTITLWGGNYTYGIALFREDGTRSSVYSSASPIGSAFYFNGAYWIIKSSEALKSLNGYDGWTAISSFPYIGSSSYGAPSICGDRYCVFGAGANSIYTIDGGLTWKAGYSLSVGELDKTAFVVTDDGTNFIMPFEAGIAYADNLTYAHKLATSVLGGSLISGLTDDVTQDIYHLKGISSNYAVERYRIKRCIGVDAAVKPKYSNEYLRIK